ncbi:MAG: N-acetylmuramoyl-L-alanine amidase [Sphingomonadaceae bacterium]|nr:N-acetylmuramoyl-L-alanine amidase [Sphingomonadaceae bacterium]
MSRAIQLALIFALPIAVLSALIVVDRTYGLPGRGYDYVLRIELPPAEAEIGLPDVHGPQDASRPLVVIDAGHGGHDPGAGQGRTREKTVTLAIAQAIRDNLLDGGGIRVALTRDSDRYLMLGERSSIARRLKADLFLSIHADSAESEMARGASVYVLSEKGSSQAAVRIAAHENKADVVNGVALSNQSEAVNAILLDLSQSESRAASVDLAGLVLRELRGKTRLHGGEVQSAAFAVLKAPDVPSVLFETGYISNPGDAAYLSSDKGRKIVSAAAARAVRAYFARRTEV